MEDKKIYKDISLGKESKKYLTQQILTYIGNKRNLLNYINEEILQVKKELNKEKLITADLFSGSGIVSRLLKQYSSKIIVNDLEEYSKVINECFLTNKKDFNKKLFNSLLEQINNKIKEKPVEGIFSKKYAPQDTEDIKLGERVFYTHENAVYIDSFRYYIDEIIPNEYKKYFLALLIIEASIHVNTCGVFKGFYKDKKTGIGKFGGTAENALLRIMSPIKIEAPVLSKFDSEVKIYQEDTVLLSSKLGELDLVYLDPPYNQHPYGSNYFMLNMILKNHINTPISKVSGIPTDWKRSNFNKKADALISMEKIIKNINSKYFLISYNNEGFISYEEMVKLLEKYGEVDVKIIKYNTFKGSHNLKKRNIYTNEYLFLLRKEK